MTVEPGQTFDRYSVEELIGEGGMGRVYRAFDTRLERRVALKVLIDAVGDGAESIAVALREARAAAAIAHPNATAVYDASEVAGTPFIAMELVAGTSLRTILAGPAPPLATRLRWLIDIAGALGAAHRTGVIHRDVKPENVMIRHDGRVKVLDFGVARRSMASGAKTAASGARVAGTPAYMAPEQIRGGPIDGRADQFGWGVLAYEVCTGRLPWRTAKDFVSFIAAVVSETPAPPSTLAPDLPPVVEAAVMRALSKNPDDRFRNMNAAAAALAPYARTSLILHAVDSSAPVEATDDATAPTIPAPPPVPAEQSPVVVPASRPVTLEPRARTTTEPSARSAPRSEPADTPARAIVRTDSGDTPARAIVRTDSGDTPSRLIARADIAEPPSRIPARAEIADAPPRAPMRSDPGDSPSRLIARAELNDAPPRAPMRSDPGDTPSRLIGRAEITEAPSRGSRPEIGGTSAEPSLRDPDFDAAVDLDAHLAALPRDATSKGMFFADLVQRTSKLIAEPDLCRTAQIGERRYVAFRDYPAADLLRLTLASARILTPRCAPGEALRRLGQTVFDTMLATHIGRALFGVLERDVEPLLLAIPKAFRLVLSTGQATCEKTAPSTFTLQLRAFPAFMEAYPIGILEGVIRHCGERGRFKIAAQDVASATIEIKLLG